MLLANGPVKSYIGRHEPEILTHLELVVDTVSMEKRHIPAQARVTLSFRSRAEQARHPR